MTDTATAERYVFSNVPVGTHIKEFGDVVHKLVQSAPWSEGDKVAALQVITDEFGHPNPIVELSIAAATAVQQNNELKSQVDVLTKRVDALLAAFAAQGKAMEGKPVGGGAPVNVPEVAADTSAAAADEAAKGYAAWKAQQEAEKQQ